MKWMFTRHSFYSHSDHHYIYDTEQEAIEAEERFKERSKTMGVSISLGIKRISDKKAAKIKEKEWEEIGKYWMTKA